MFREVSVAAFGRIRQEGCFDVALFITRDNRRMDE